MKFKERGGKYIMKKSGYSLQRTMIVYFLLIGFASLLVGVEFIVETHGSELKNELVENFNQYEQHQIAREQIFRPIEKMRNKAILMIVIILFVMLIVLTMFMKNITEPLQHMIETAQKISAGDLRQTISIHSQNELAELGNVINELSSNLQETSLLSKNIYAAGTGVIQNIKDLLNKEFLTAEDRQSIKDGLTLLQKEFGQLHDIADYFQVYSLGK